MLFRSLGLRRARIAIEKQGALGQAWQGCDRRFVRLVGCDDGKHRLGPGDRFGRGRSAENARRRAIHLRESMYAVFSALMDRQLVPPVAMDVLNSSIQDAAQHLRLIQREKIPSKIVSPEPTVEWRFDDLGSAFDAMLWPITRAAADLLASSDLGFVRACSSPTCQWFFLDTSKNHHRRWCSMQLCGNRTKVRKFYAKKKKGVEVAQH